MKVIYWLVWNTLKLKAGKMNGNSKTSKTNKHNKQFHSEFEKLRNFRTAEQDFHLTKSLMIYVRIHYLNTMI
jgi:hypothetical protein